MKMKSILNLGITLLFVLTATDSFASENDLTVLNRYSETIQIVNASSAHDFYKSQSSEGKSINAGESLTISVVPKNSYWVEIGTSKSNYMRAYIEYNKKTQKYTLSFPKKIGNFCLNKMLGTGFSVVTGHCK
ncbi:hypothetical protein BH10PSE19_BH10PSE19_01160 [soil metagenome]